MGTDRQDSYQEQTEKNVIKPKEWGDNDADLSADFNGISDFTNNMHVLSQNFRDDGRRAMQPLHGLVTKAVGTGGLPDGLAMRTIISANLGELSTFFANGEQSETNLQWMMQTIKDSLGGTDSWSALNITGAGQDKVLEAVKFATVQPGAERPDGLPSAIGKTYMDALIEQMSKGKQPGADTSGLGTYQETGRRPDQGGVGYWVYKEDQFGNTVAIHYDNSDQVIDTTYTPVNGTPYTIAEKTTYQGGDKVVTTTKTVYDEHGKAHETTSSTRTHVDGSTTTVTNYGNDGKPTDSTETVEHGDGSTTTTHSTYDPKGHEHEGDPVNVADDPEVPNVPMNPTEGIPHNNDPVDPPSHSTTSEPTAAPPGPTPTPPATPGG